MERSGRSEYIRRLKPRHRRTPDRLRQDPAPSARKAIETELNDVPF